MSLSDWLSLALLSTPALLLLPKRRVFRDLSLDFLRPNRDWDGSRSLQLTHTHTHAQNSHSYHSTPYIFSDDFSNCCIKRVATPVIDYDLSLTINCPWCVLVTCFNVTLTYILYFDNLFLSMTCFHITITLLCKTTWQITSPGMSSVLSPVSPEKDSIGPIPERSENRQQQSV